MSFRRYIEKNTQNHIVFQENFKNNFIYCVNDFQNILLCINSLRWQNILSNDHDCKWQSAGVQFINQVSSRSPKRGIHETQHSSWKTEENEYLSQHNKLWQKLLCAHVLG